MKSLQSFSKTLKETSKAHRLSGYFRMIQFSGPLTIFSIAVLLYFYPAYFEFMGPKDAALLLLLFVFFADLLCFVFQIFLRHRIFFTLLRFSWIVFFSALISISGGVASPIMYLLVFPLLVAGTDLEKKDVLIVSALILAFLGTLFAIDAGRLSPQQMGLHIFTFVIFSILSYYFYQLVKEKEIIHQDFNRLMEVDHLKSDFISVASNRLRTPLTAALYAFEALAEGKATPDQQNKIVSEGLAHVKVANAVVNELVRAVELDAYHFKIFPEIVDIPKLIQEIHDDLSGLIRSKGVTFSLISPAVLTIKANPGMMKLALGNIIDNAVRYSPQGTVEVMVAEGKERACEITIRDTGIGIAESDLPLIFERLFRGDEAVHVDANRSGIGMYTAKRVIDLHHGSVALTSKRGKGTTVRITLPVV